MTPNNDCHQLDAYLADDLSARDASRFESHLETCSECRDAADEQKWVDSLLQSPARIQLEHTPATILDSVRSSVVRRERRVLRIAYGFAAAAVLLISVGWFVLNSQVVRSKATTNQDVVVADVAPVATQVGPQATFVAATDAIVVPLESPSDDVTIVQVYPTTDAERRLRLDMALSTNL